MLNLEIWQSIDEGDIKMVLTFMRIVDRSKGTIIKYFQKI